MPEESPESARGGAPAPFEPPKDYATVMIHFYRGELGRIMTWRQRLDVTTNWAVVSATGLITFALSSPQNSHWVFLLANLIVLLLLVIEGRRYRYYDAYRARVRMLEAHFIMPMLMGNRPLLEGDWRSVMAEDLVCPSFKIGRLDALARRLRRNYAYIFAVIGAGWLLKLWMHYPQSHTLGGLVEVMLGGRSLPSRIVFGVTVLFYVFVAGLLVWSWAAPEGAGEFQQRAMRRRRWLS